ncbi:hypothetical protein [Agrococcus sp. HG114]|uniref:hypothetical protein n=1 Tax=Agrococcus sp. HG114 TaxID=2969757 RepID=UPI00215A82EB|nr:hypothetical protein [Agrococcus sp. HG114]MCR8669990.1 hypothetical protein [Agrococcus sp. HG114]
MTLIDDRPAQSAVLTPPERKARRKRFLSWLMPAIGIALIAGIFLLTQQILAGGLGQPREALPEEVSANNTTQFGEAGTSYAVQYQVVTLNLSERPIPASDLSMADDAQAVIAPGYGFLDTTMYVGEGGGLNGEGYFSEMMSSVTATTERGVVQRFDMQRAPVGWAEFPSAMRAVQTGSAAFGWDVDQADIDAFATATAEAVRRGEPSSWQIRATGLMGVPVSGSVDCTGEGLCTLSYSVDVSGQAVGR